MSAGALRPQNVVPAAITRGSKPVLNTLQTERGIRIDVDRSRDRLLTDFGKATLDDRYLLPGESYQDLFARVASHYADDTAHAHRIYSYMSKLLFMPAPPVLSHGGTSRGKTGRPSCRERACQ